MSPRRRKIYWRGCWWRISSSALTGLSCYKLIYPKVDLSMKRKVRTPSWKNWGRFSARNPSAHIQLQAITTLMNTISTKRYPMLPVIVQGQKLLARTIDLQMSRWKLLMRNRLFKSIPMDITSKIFNYLDHQPKELWAMKRRKCLRNRRRLTSSQGNHPRTFHLPQPAITLRWPRRILCLRHLWSCPREKTSSNSTVTAHRESEWQSAY